MKQKNAFRIFIKRLLLSGFFAVSFFVFSITFSNTDSAFASETNGTIDATYKYAWGENIGWINFGCDDCDVSITDSSITGYAWSSQFGWINLNPTTSGVANTDEGVLSGMAWSSNLGWINFDGVTINSGGEFIGYATLDSNSSQINFNCANGSSCSDSDFKVKTDWRPTSARTQVGGVTSSGSRPRPQQIIPVTPPVKPNPIVVILDNAGEKINSLYDSFLSFFRPKKEPVVMVVEIPKIAPIALKVRWNLLPVKAIREFVFAPLPYEVRILANKFPELKQTLKDVGIDRLSDVDQLSGVTFNMQGLNELAKTLQSVGIEKFSDIDKLSGIALNTQELAELEKILKNVGVKELSDIDKIKGITLNTKGLAELAKTLQSVGIEKLTDIDRLKGVTLNIPAISNIDGKVIGSVGAGKISLIQGLPVTAFPLATKKNLPTEFVFARASGELVDLNVAISIGEKGQVTQKISSLPGKTLKLVVKPISRARSVTGYFIFKSATPRITKAETEISRSSLTASALFSVESLVEKNPEPIPVENKLVLSTFEYTDSDKDGIYTADVISPVVPGEYEIITVIDYIDPVLGVRQMRMITVIDPEGYVFEKNNGKETRIPSAIVSLYELNHATKKYELWPAENYQQENPQITDVRGTYSFLVPEGSYYFEVEAPGYDHYEGKVFVVTEGAGVHQNIELKSGGWWIPGVDWKTVLLIVVFLLLVYNLYRNNVRDRLLKTLKINGK